MALVNLLEALSPHARVVTAVAPFALAVVLRLVLGRSRFTRTLISLGTMWFAINVMAAPYSERMQEEIRSLRAAFR